MQKLAIEKSYEMRPYQSEFSEITSHEKMDTEKYPEKYRKLLSSAKDNVSRIFDDYICKGIDVDAAHRNMNMNIAKPFRVIEEIQDKMMFNSEAEFIENQADLYLGMAKMNSELANKFIEK